MIGKSYSLLGGVVPERPIDRSAYLLSDELVAASDPVHLTMLEVAGDALRHAGIEPFNIPLRNAGVYIGHGRGSLRSAMSPAAFTPAKLRQLPAKPSRFAASPPRCSNSYCQRR